MVLAAERPATALVTWESRQVLLVELLVLAQLILPL
jgi:hypothetical protein